MRLIDADAMTPETIIEIKRVFGRGGRLRTARTSVQVIRYSRLIDAPTLDYEPVRRGKWIMVSPDGSSGVCNICNRSDGIDPLATHCRYCGARMEAEMHV